MLESVVAKHVRLEHATYYHGHLWRNQSGAFIDPDSGRMVRFGLANDSAQLNKRIKSSDFIGITPVTITPDMVGRTIGVFTAIETKDSDWRRIRSDARAAAQDAYMDIVRQSGGIATFARGPHDLHEAVRSYLCSR
jgi:hypothetical protein